MRPCPVAPRRDRAGAETRSAARFFESPRPPSASSVVLHPAPPRPSLPPPRPRHAPAPVRHRTFGPRSRERGRALRQRGIRPARRLEPAFPLISGVRRPDPHPRPWPLLPVGDRVCGRGRAPGTELRLRPGGGGREGAGAARRPESSLGLGPVLRPGPRFRLGALDSASPVALGLPYPYPHPSNRHCSILIGGTRSGPRRGSLSVSEPRLPGPLALRLGSDLRGR